MRWREKKQLRDIVISSDIIALQETHGNDTAAAKLISNNNLTHEGFFSGHPDQATGGCILLIRNRLLGPDQQTEHTILLPGRAQQVRVSRRGASITIFNVHNEKINRSQKRRLHRSISRATSYAAADLTGASFVVLLGDFNYVPLGECPIRVPPRADVALVPAPASVAEARRWRDVLAPFTEIYQDAPTRVGPIGTAALPAMLGSRIDRIYISLPPLGPCPATRHVPPLRVGGTMLHVAP
jgi:endonuclease/exonuclease/phosphatase family metal-dependent hydrolase